MTWRASEFANVVFLADERERRRESVTERTVRQERQARRALYPPSRNVRVLSRAWDHVRPLERCEFQVDPGPDAA